MSREGTEETWESSLAEPAGFYPRGSSEQVRLTSKPTPDESQHGPLLSSTPFRKEASGTLKPTPAAQDDLRAAPQMLPPPSPEVRRDRTLLPGVPLAYTSPLSSAPNFGWKNTLNTMWNFMSGTRLIDTPLSVNDDGNLLRILSMDSTTTPQLLVNNSFFSPSSSSSSSSAPYSPNTLMRVDPHPSYLQHHQQQQQQFPSTTAKAGITISEPNLAAAHGSNVASQSVPNMHSAKRHQLGGNSWLVALQLNVWDNIFGPRSEKVWQGAHAFPEEIRSFITRASLPPEQAPSCPSPPLPMGLHDADGALHPVKQVSSSDSMLALSSSENSNNPSPSSAASAASPPLHAHVPWFKDVKIHLYPSLGDGVIMFVVTFESPFSRPLRKSAVKPANKDGKFSLVLLLRHQDLDRAFLLQTVLERRLVHLMMKLQHLLRSHVMPTALEQFSSAVAKFSDALQPLYFSSLPPPRFRASHFFSLAHHAQNHAQNVAFLARAVTSHLHTRCSTVVVGSDTSLINSMVDSLSIFLTPSERARSSYAVPGRGFVPDLILQGVLSDAVSSEDLIQSSLPSTVISVDAMTVEQTPLADEYAALHSEYILNDAEQLAWATPALLQSLKEPAPPILRLISEVVHLAPPVREGYIIQCYQSLVRAAITLIRYTEHISRAHPEKRSPDLDSIRRLRAHLKLESIPDFILILSIAEKKQPGIYTCLAGDLQSIEDKFVELFESPF